MNSSLWYFPISALVNALTSLVLALVVILLNYNKKIARYLIFLCVASAAWSGCYYYWQIATDAQSALFWSKMLMFGAICTPLAYLHLVVVFLEKEREKKYKIFLIILYFLSTVWIFSNLTNYFVAGVEPRSYFKFWPVPGSVYAPFLMMFVFQFIFASYLLYKNSRNLYGAQRKQSILLMIGVFIAFIGGSTNYFLWYNVPIPPWGNGLVSIYVFLTVYAMMKYKFLNVKVMAAELFTVFLLIVLLFSAVISRDFWEIILRSFAFVISLVFGVLLIRSIRTEVERKDEITKLAHSLEQANIRLKELDRQKTEFVSIAAHQLRTPLSILKGYIELIKDGGYGKVPKGVVGVLNNMDESNEHLIKLVDEFLDITRIEQGRTKYDFKPCDMLKVVESVVNELQNRAEQKGLKVEWNSLSGRKARAVIDEEKVRHVIFNFVDNAIKYSEKGTIKVDVTEEERGIAVRVKDHGIGFGKVDEGNFFQKFYRGNNVKGINVGGTGLGLYVTSKFIEAHGGRIWGKSVGLGKGSEFGFWVPLKRR